MKQLTWTSVVSLLLLMVLAVPINAQQPPPAGPSEAAGAQDSSKSPNVQQPSDSNSTTPNLNRETSSPGSIQPGPINSNVPGTPATTSAPNVVLALVSLAVGVGIGYLIGRRRPGMRTSTGTGMPNPGRA